MKKKEEDLYREVMGKEHSNLPEDHPDRWQWEYRGTKSEREELLKRLGISDEDDIPTQEESLW